MAQNADIKEAAAHIAATIEGMQNGQERYIVLERGEDRRVAFIAAKRAGEVVLTLEVQLRLVSSTKGRELDGMASAVAVASALLANGYSSGDQEEAWVCCEKQVTASSLMNEIDSILSLAGGC